MSVRWIQRHGVANARCTSAGGTNAKYRLALKLSAYRVKPEVIGAQSE
jgi:hypothetical protein